MLRQQKPPDFLSSGDDSDSDHDSQIPELSSASSQSTVDLERDLQMTSSDDDSDIFGFGDANAPEVDVELADQVDPGEETEDGDENPVPLKSERGQPQIGHAGFVYAEPKEMADGVTVAWRCQRRKSDRCNCRVHTMGKDGPIVSTIGTHSHLGSPINAKVNMLKNALKERASATFEPPIVIVGAVLENVPDLVQQAGPSKAAASMLINRKRKLDAGFDPEPNSRLTIAVPERLSNYITGNQSEPFLLLDSGANDSDRILVFGRGSVAADVSYVSALYVDGTFSITPPLFDQVFVITGRRGNFVQPLFYVLLPNRQKVTYAKLYRMLLEAYPDLKPQAIYMDFELALISATLKSFPDARLNGCYFHLVQAVLRHLTGDLRKLFMYSEIINTHVRMILALAYVPEARMRVFVSELRKNIDNRLHELLSYFETTYIGATVRVRKRTRNTSVVMVTRKEPRFAISMWSQHARLLNGDDATNNYSEGTHNRCRRFFRVSHPSLWRFIRELHGLQRALDFEYNRYRAGDAKPVKDAIWMRNARIQNVMADIEHRSEWDYLQGIAVNLHLE